MSISTQPAPPIDLLRIEMAVLWDVDAQGRIGGPVDVAVGIAVDGITAAVGQHVPGDVARRILDRVGRETPPRPGEVPGFLHKMLTAGLVLSGGPSYHIQPPINAPGDIRVLRSDGPAAAEVRNMRPDNWQPDEWTQLVNGGAGAPWAMVLDQGRVVSICHTPRRTSAGAEAGTWTDPEFRGRGYAAATTAAWADLLALQCPHLFYSTSADNYSSQHVAERLQLRPIGWIWKLSRSPAGGQEPFPERCDRR